MEVSKDFFEYVAGVVLLIAALSLVVYTVDNTKGYLNAQSESLTWQLEQVSDVSWKSYAGRIVKGDTVNYLIDEYGDSCFFKAVTRSNPSGFSEFSQRTVRTGRGYIDGSASFLCKTIYASNGTELGMVFIEEGISEENDVRDRNRYVAMQSSVSAALQTSREEAETLTAKADNVTLSAEAGSRLTEYGILYKQYLILKLKSQLLDYKLSG